MNSADITGWLVSPSVRSRGTRWGAVLFNTRDGRWYWLNGVAARIWAAIEGNPAGISLEGIVDMLEPHSTATREELEKATGDCLRQIQRAGLLREGDGNLEHFSMKESKTMIFEHPIVQRLTTVDSLVDQLFPQGGKGKIDWRAKKLKDLIDQDPAKVQESLGQVCNQLQFSLSDRQARRLFKESAGISMKEYARNRRLAFSAKRLQNTVDSIKVIAADAGYRTVQGFEKAFYRMFRLRPVEFRRIWQRNLIAT